MDAAAKIPVLGLVVGALVAEPLSLTGGVALIVSIN
jgi:hypothetical protein